MKTNRYEKINNFMKNLKYALKSMPIKIKIIALIILVILVALISIAIIRAIRIDESKQKYEVYDGTNLDESKYPGYKELIDNLQTSHPNWTFTLFYTKLDWNEVIANEGHSDLRTNPLNLIPDSSSYPEDWRCEICGNKRYDNGTWLCEIGRAHV